MTKKNKKTLTSDASTPDIECVVSALCARVPVSAGMPELVKELAHVMPHLFFRAALTRNGWYRLAGLVDRDGRRVADDLVQWIETELAARRAKPGPIQRKDLRALTRKYAASGYRSTRLIGKTHYLVASTGTDAMNFMQIELEEMFEVAGHELFAGAPPDSLEDLIDRPCAKGGQVIAAPIATPLGAPFYKLRRITNVAELIERLAAEQSESQNVPRFLSAWQSSSAGLSAEFSKHWVLAVREHLDCDQLPVMQATPVAAISGPLPRFECSFGAYGLALYDALEAFDRQVGYPMAWFFHMLTTKAVPHAAANAVVDDVQAGFSYLPARDVKVIKDWLHRRSRFR